MLAFSFYRDTVYLLLYYVMRFACKRGMCNDNFISFSVIVELV